MEAPFPKDQFRFLHLESFNWPGGILLISLTFMVACGSNASPALAPAITTQPSNQSTRVGQTVTFTVVAGGTTPLKYQWMKNGTALSDATAAAYTTTAAVAADNGAIFTATVSNAMGSAMSNPVTLNVGPRAPADGDWRFQGIDLPASSSYQVSNLTETMTASYTNFIGSPLEIGAVPGNCVSGVAYDCAWFYSVSNLPSGVSGLSTYYQSDVFGNLDADLSALISPNIVVTSLDLEPANQVFAVSWLQMSGPSRFNLQSQWVAPADLQTVASQLGTESRVITAISFNTGEVDVLSYAWQSDTITAYDVKVVPATAADFWTDAMGLAQAGYIITAMGGDPADGILLVGTRVQGDSIPRPFAYYTAAGTQGKISTTVFSLPRLIYLSDGGDSFSEQ